jgi:tetratricopeptide (TPR) repeat protein
MPISPVISNASQPRRTLRAGVLARACVLSLGLAILGLQPAHAESLDEANQLLRAGQHAKALEQVNRHLAAKPKDAQGRFLKGIILTGLNKPAEAVAVFQKLTEDYPELPEPYNNLAVIYAQQKQYEKAKQALEMAIRTHPAYATAHENLGDIYSRLASQAYGKALSIDSSNASAQTKLAMINELVGGGTKVGAGKTVASKPAEPIPAPTATPVAPPAPVVVAAAETKPQEPPRPAAKPVEPKPAEAKPAAETKPAPPAKPEPAKPEPAAAKPAADANGEIAAAVDAWLAAWSKKDVKTYLAHYARDFQVPGGQSRKAWETEHAQRVGKPGKIEVGRDKLAIKIEGDSATVHFRQSYKSAGFNSSSGKTLIMVKREGKWQIQQERVGG